MEENELRTQAILRDIYARHGIEDGTTPQEALDAVMGAQDENGEFKNYKFGSTGGEQRSGFANPAERAAAMKAHALKGTSTADVQRRWDQGQYLMDADTADTYKRYKRDTDFIESHIANKKPQRTDGNEQKDAHNSYGQQGGSFAAEVAAHRDREQGAALDRWDRLGAGAGNLHRDSWSRPNTHAASGWSAGLGNLIQNREGPIGATFAATEYALPGFMSLFGGENNGRHSNAARDMVAVNGTDERFRDGNPSSQSPVLDQPTGATAEQKDARLGLLDELRSAAAQPGGVERMERTTGWRPPPVVGDVADGVLAALDPTILLTTMGGGPAWQMAKSLAWDHLQDQATTPAVRAAFPSTDPDRSWAEYLVGTGATKMKRPDKVLDAQDARQQMYDDHVARQRQQSVSGAAAQAYNQLQKGGAVNTTYR